MSPHTVTNRFLPSGGQEARRFTLFIVLALVLHIAVLLWYASRGGEFGVPGPGDGEVLTFQLAAGPGHDEDAAAESLSDTDQPLVEAVPEQPAPPEPEPVVEDVVVEEVVVETPPEPAAIPLKKPQEEVALPKEEVVVAPQQETASPAPVKQVALPPGGGTVGQDAAGAQGEEATTILNKEGSSLTGGEVEGILSGRTLHLEIGRLDIKGNNRLFDAIIEIHDDGTTDVELIHYHYKTFHRAESSTRRRTASGKWWIEGDRWCHQSRIIEYNTRNCYDMTEEGITLRFYHGVCRMGASPYCKAGRLAARGAVQ